MPSRPFPEGLETAFFFAKPLNCGLGKTALLFGKRQFPESYAGVVAAEAERVGKAERELRLDGLVGRVVQIAGGVGIVEVDGRGHGVVAEGQDGGHGFGCAGRAEHVAVHRLRAADVNLVCSFAESYLIGCGLRNVVQLGAGAVGVDVYLVFGGVISGLLEGQADAAGLGAAVRTGGR